MRYRLNFARIVFVHVMVMLISPTLVQAVSNQNERLQFDFQGDTHYSRYNFTDIKKPYDGVDGWAELKIAYWIDAEKSFSPYFSLLPAFTTENEFWWQRNFQIAAGSEFPEFPGTRFLSTEIPVPQEMQ